MKACSFFFLLLARNSSIFASLLVSLIITSLNSQYVYMYKSPRYMQIHIYIVRIVLIGFSEK